MIVRKTIKAKIIGLTKTKENIKIFNNEKNFELYSAISEKSVPK